MGYKRISWMQTPQKKRHKKVVEEQPMPKPKRNKKVNPPQTSDVGKGSEEK